MLKKLLLLGTALTFGSAGIAHADAIGTTALFSLTLDGCTGGCGVLRTEPLSLNRRQRA